MTSKSLLLAFLNGDVNNFGNTPFTLMVCKHQCYNPPFSQPFLIGFARISSRSPLASLGVWTPWTSRPATPLIDQLRDRVRSSTNHMPFRTFRSGKYTAPTQREGMRVWLWHSLQQLCNRAALITHLHYTSANTRPVAIVWLSNAVFPLIEAGSHIQDGSPWAS